MKDLAHVFICLFYYVLPNKQRINIVIFDFQYRYKLLLQFGKIEFLVALSIFYGNQKIIFPASLFVYRDRNYICYESVFLVSPIIFVVEPCQTNMREIFCKNTDRMLVLNYLRKSSSQMFGSVLNTLVHSVIPF